MLGAIAGDVIGSVYEHHHIKTTEFPLFQAGCVFTDDTVMTVAVADAILSQSDYAASMKAFGRKYQHAGYGSAFINWIFEDQVRPYNSWGNGSAMRVSPIGLAFDDVDTVLQEAVRTAEVSHNHPEGIKGAQATALAVLMARKGESKEQIRHELSRRFGYNLARTIDEIRPAYHFDVSCQGTVPEAVIAFLDSSSYEDAVRKAISLGGDSDTLACITGGIAQAFYKGVPPEIVVATRMRLTQELLRVVDEFEKKYSM